MTGTDDEPPDDIERLIQEKVIAVASTDNVKP